MKINTQRKPQNRRGSMPFPGLFVSRFGAVAGQSLALLVCMAAFLFNPGCASAPTSFPAPSAGGFPAPTDPTLLAAGDIIRLDFSGAPELSQSQRIRPDGKLTLPLIGEVNAAGETFGNLQKDLETKYKAQLKNSDVAVTLESSTTRTVTVDGAVRTPGNIPCDRPLTAFEVIMMAGGFSDDANVGKVQIIRMVNGADRSVIMDLRGAMHGKPVPGISVQPGDIINVPDKIF